MNDQTNRSRMGLTNEGGGVCQPASADSSTPSLATLSMSDDHDSNRSTPEESNGRGICLCSIITLVFP